MLSGFAYNINTFKLTDGTLEDITRLSKRQQNWIYFNQAELTNVIHAENNKKKLLETTARSLIAINASDTGRHAKVVASFPRERERERERERGREGERERERGKQRGANARFT